MWPASNTLRAGIAIALLLLAFLLGWLSRGFFQPCQCAEVTGTKSVTTVRRDTIRPAIPKPTASRTEKRVIVKRPQGNEKTPEVTEVPTSGENENAVPRIEPNGDISVPITERVYETKDYKATVRGFMPELADLQLYRETITTTNTVTVQKPKRWALTVGPGLNYDGGQVRPTYISATLGFVLWSK